MNRSFMDCGAGLIQWNVMRLAAQTRLPPTNRAEKTLRKRPSWQLAVPYLKAAAGEARILGHGYVAPEHILLVLARSPGNFGRAFFDRHGMHTNALRDALAAILGPLTAAPRSDLQLDTTQRCDRALEIAARASAPAVTVIDPDDLLRALLSRDVADDAVIGALLHRLGIDTDTTRAEIASLPVGFLPSSLNPPRDRE